MRQYLTLLFLSLFATCLSAQDTSMDYYLPDVNLDRSIPSPQDVLGFEVGKWHLSHDQLVRYLYELAEASDNIQIEEYGRTHEDRPLILLTISSPKNLENLEEIRQRHLLNADPNAENVDVSDDPVVVYQGFSIHGNEPSGANAAVLLAYYLAAGKGRQVEKFLDDAVILLDPCFNPDGFHRFSTWANMHKSAVGNADPNSREFNEVWPGGRTNHYWFDLNRDWLLAQHPESQGRLRLFHKWKPNVLTDHHEMGTNATFFFQPGVPQRTNPLTPDRNQQLTAEIGNFHAAALDEIGSLYYSQENFDDYYYGKGSTYPDINGSVGILFEQGSSRGHVQESENGLVFFPFTIRNQLKTAISTLEGSVSLRKELLDYQKEFYSNAAKEAFAERRKAFIYGELHDQTRLRAFTDLLQLHQIETFELNKEVQANGTTFKPGKAFVVPLQQDQYRLIRTIFETTDTFKDSLFYDVSAWTLPMAFNLEFESVEKGDLAGNPVSESSWLEIEAPEYSEYAYLIEWDDYAAPKAANKLLEAGLRVKVAMQPFQTNRRSFDRGTLMIPVAGQSMGAETLHNRILAISESCRIKVYDADTGLTPAGIDLGSRQFQRLELPEVLLVGGSGTYSYEVGEMWYLLEERLGIPASIVEADRLSRINLDRYNVILLAHGSYGSLGASGTKKLQEWVRSGGTLWCQRGAVNWAISNQLSGAVVQKETDEAEAETEEKPEWQTYSSLSANSGSRVIGGAILSAEADLSHPLLFGFKRNTIPVFRRGTLFLEDTENPYASPLRYSKEPVLSGYVHESQVEKISGSPALVVSRVGSGRVICSPDNLNFRAYWYGTQKLTTNAIFFGHLISGRAAEAVKPPPAK
ncbi:MAG: zinc carboxypeptidase [Bacteroidetes bacterium]|nr:zinc carboxypeptidase [Bacteroidota bacterium]